MKKFLSIILTITMLCVMSVTTFATSVDFESSKSELVNVHIIDENGMVSSTTLDDIASLVRERNRAILAGDTDKEEKFQQALENSGAYKSTSSELASLSGGDAIALASSNVTYNTIQYSAVVSGKTYKIKETIAYPTTNSNLFHSASVNNKSFSSSVSAGAYEFLKVMGSTAAGHAYTAVDVGISVYDILKSVIDGFSTSTIVYGITANYSCAALEQVSFYQVYMNGTWTPFASSSYVQTASNATIFSTNYSGGSKTGLNMATRSVENVMYAKESLNSKRNGYNTSDILGRYFKSYLFDKRSQVTRADFYNDADGTAKYVKSFGMICPTTTGNIT